MKTTTALTPPMGWNSWDCFGASVTEEEVRANANIMATRLHSYGWNYIVVDIQWHEPRADSHDYHPFVPLVMDGYSRLMPAENRFPSAKNGAGFKPLAEYVHQLGLRFGIHILRGIPRQAVHADTPILGASIGARSIAHANSICRWNTDMYGIDAEKPGAQAYYHSLFELYASWEVDFVKVDDIASPYHSGEIELIRNAIDHCGREMLLSLSPGPAPLEEADHLKRMANMWRMSDDLWDRWADIEAQFERCAQWVRFAGPGHWPDADMLPLGRLIVRSNGGHMTHLSPDEQVAVMTLWCMARSPLMMGGDLRSLNDWTYHLLTNTEILKILTDSCDNHQVMRNNSLIVWTAKSLTKSETYLAFFNLSADLLSITGYFSQFGIEGSYAVRELWTHEQWAEPADSITMQIAPHGAKLYSLQK